jgi:hypothetical protein
MDTVSHSEESVEPETTCGTGIAENAILPARLADLMASMAAVLDVHQRALDPTDASSRLEIEAYQMEGPENRVSNSPRGELER